MNLSQDTDETLWWETELPKIRGELHAYLKRRFPALNRDHDDLLSDTFLALTQQIRRHSSKLPVSWFKRISPASQSERSHLHKLAMVIIKRRIADHFRKRASLPYLSTTDDLRQDEPDPNAPKPEKNILLARLLEVTLSVLDEMEPEDRDLIALISEANFRKALNPRERQRLHRARKRLKDEIARRLGAEVADLLRITL